MCKASGPEWYKVWSIADNVGALSRSPGFHCNGSVCHSLAAACDAANGLHLHRFLEACPW